jgi:hypothetical protein
LHFQALLNHSRIFNKDFNYLTRDYHSGFINDREKYGGIPQNPPHYPGRKFTSDQLFNFKIAEITEI